MKDKNEQAAAVAASDDLGKFGTVAELYAAYNELEREFTKRCQLIKQLQARLSPDSAQAQAEHNTEPDAVIAPEPEAVVAAETAPTVGEVGDTAPGATADGATAVAAACAASLDRDAVLGEIAAHAEAYADSLAELSAVMDACLSRYKQKLISFDISAPPSGLAVIVPKKRPRTLADAKRLADEMLLG